MVAAPPVGQYKYSDSSDPFVKFFTNGQPFAKDFDEARAYDFYESIRCGLLHEARTEMGWTIWAKASGGAVIEAQRKIVCRTTSKSHFSVWSNGIAEHCP